MPTKKKVTKKAPEAKPIEMVHMEIKPLDAKVAESLAFTALNLTHLLVDGKIKEADLQFDQTFGKVNLTFK